MASLHDNREQSCPGMEGVKEQERVEGDAPMDCDKRLPSAQEQVPYFCPNFLLILSKFTPALC